jgi:hypothetical protein
MTPPTNVRIVSIDVSLWDLTLLCLKLTVAMFPAFLLFAVGTFMFASCGVGTLIGVGQQQQQQQQQQRYNPRAAPDPGSLYTP